MSSLMMNAAVESREGARRRRLQGPSREVRETVPTPVEARALLPELAAAVLTGGTVRDALRHAFDATFPAGESGVLTRSQMFALRWNDLAWSEWRADLRRIHDSGHDVPAHVLDVAVRECRERGEQ